MSADIEPISDFINWSSTAAAVDAAQQIEHDTPFIALWVTKDGEVRWRKANMTFTASCEITAILQAMTTKWSLQVLG
jgi:hypothetical protein